MFAVPSVLVRALAIVCRPRVTWSRIATESTSALELLISYVVPLAAIGAFATYIGLRSIGIRIAAGQTFHASVAVARSESLASFGFALGGVTLVVFYIAALAPRFGLERSFGSAARIASYALTPVWIAGVTLLAPQLALVRVFAALYAVVLLALGLEIVLGAPRRRAALFAAAVIGCAFASAFVFGAGAAIVRGMAKGAPP